MLTTNNIILRYYLIISIIFISIVLMHNNIYNEDKKHRHLIRNTVNAISLKKNLSNLPFIIDHIPTDKKEVFITIDDGSEKDDNFITMVRQQHIPFVMFLADVFIKNNYNYFSELQSLGNNIENHTINHFNLKTKNYEEQKNEICGMRDKINNIYHKQPILFRPPGGYYNDDTIKAAQACNMQHLILWKDTMQIDDMRYQDKNLHSGDIILAHFRGPQQLKGVSMIQMMQNLLDSIKRQGFTVGNLNDYLN